jgi:hypothetical protein
MTMRVFSRTFFVYVLIVSAGVLVAAAPEISKQQGDRLERKIAEIAKNGSAAPVRPKKTFIPETELNSYLNHNIKDRIPRGLTHPHISMLGNGNLAGRVLVDLDEFKRQRGAGGVLDPLSYISGRVPLTARGVLRTKDGRGQLQLTSAEIHGVPVPKPLVQELITFFSRTKENPRGIDIDEPFALPARIREIVANQGEAVVVQ